MGLTIGIGNDAGVHMGALLKLLPLPNNDLIQVSSIDELTGVGDSPWTAISSGNGTQSISLYKPERVRQNCSILQVSLYIIGYGYSEIVFQVWRKNGLTYDLVGQSDLTELFVTPNVINTATLPIPISALCGDYIAWRFKAASARDVTVLRNSAINNSMMWTSELQTITGFDWDTKSGILYKLATHCRATAPLLACVGDSIMECAPNTSSMLAVLEVPFDDTKSWTYKLNTLNKKLTYQNNGIGSQDMRQIEARFDRDIVSIKPKIAVINGGVNDIYIELTKSLYLANYTSILNKCLANNIIPIIWKIMPWTNGTNSQLQMRDDWNDDLVTLFNSYNQKDWIIIDWDADLGQNRVGGDVGNLWDIKPEFMATDGLGVHYNEVGEAKKAEVMLREIKKKFRV